MMRKSIYFMGPGAVAVVEEDLAAPGAGEVQVASRASLVSAGTELLLFRGETPKEMAADDTLPALQVPLAYPVKYGYAAVGDVVGVGEKVEGDWAGKRVFAFNPHESAFNAGAGDLLLVPEGCKDADAVFLANMETAINLILDAAPRLGERVVVIGQGVVGLLSTALLARHPLGALVTFDPQAGRRARSVQLGAGQSFDPEAVSAARGALGAAGADVVIELSGHPEALELALELVGREGRIVVGSWYGTRQASLDLGGRFHRQRIQLISSHVGAIQPGLRGRWDRTRRFDLAWEMLAAIQPSQLISHHFGIEQAGEAYGLLDVGGDEVLGVVLNY